MKEKYFSYFHTGIFFVFLYLVLQIPYANKWVNFSDAYDYMHQAKIPLSSEFLSPKNEHGFYPRAFIPPLIYKIADVNEYRIFEIQKLIHCITSALLLLSLMQFITKIRIKYLLAVAYYTFMCWWNIIGWSSLLTSESLNISFFFLWLAAVVHLFHRFNYTRITLFLLASFVLIFTRDTWSYIVLCFVVMLTILCYACHRDVFRRSLFISGTIVIFFMLHHKTVATGQRDKLALFNTLIARIVPNPAYFKWYTGHGLPSADTLTAGFGHFNIDDEVYIKRAYQAYDSAAYKPVLDWIVRDGRSVYIKFLLTHPSYFFLVKENKKRLREIFVQDLRQYINAPPLGFYNTVASLIPVFNNWLVLALSVVCLLIYYREKKLIYTLPFLMIVLCILNAFLIYNADAFERERHFYLVPITLQLTGIFSVVILANLSLLEIRRAPPQNKNDITA